ncbi:thioredoxin-related transmembrane protein 2 homolog isoform X1 [Tubulanus polymorphus]|uniref:thioredoxin-related transmembrane protein 2 homolog isoform X1 n=1 Tax=Tubulanus polymorphus TaxID=672921 RepID=UPI003DA57331
MFKFNLNALKHYCHPHYVTNIILSLCYFVLKKTPHVCSALFDDCEMEMREWELLTFFGCVLVAKHRKQNSTSDYIGTVFMFTKIISVVMFFRQSPVYALVYALLAILHLVCLPEPTYSGPESIVYFRGQSLEDEVVRGDKRVTWLVEFYAPWSPPCVKFAPTFSELSHKYHLDNLRFGKVDVSRYPQVAEKFNIDHSSWSKQLPTMIVFQNGKEKIRRPVCEGKKAFKFALNEENVIREMQLNDIYLQCKKNPLPKKRGKNQLEENGKAKAE